MPGWASFTMLWRSFRYRMYAFGGRGIFVVLTGRDSGLDVVDCFVPTGRLAQTASVLLTRKITPSWSVKCRGAPRKYRSKPVPSRMYMTDSDTCSLTVLATKYSVSRQSDSHEATGDVCLGAFVHKTIERATETKDFHERMDLGRNLIPENLGIGLVQRYNGVGHDCV